MTVTQIAVPVTLAAILSYVFQFVKPLLQNLPGFRDSDASHDDALRFAYGALVFLAVGGYQLYTSGTPATLDGWLSLVLALLTTSATMAVAAHYNYQAMSGSSASAAPAPAETATAPDFPPGAPSLAALGLPTAPVASAPAPTLAAAA